MKKGAMGHGFSIGRWTDPAGVTGCTDVLGYLAPQAVAATVVDAVRGRE